MAGLVRRLAGILPNYAQIAWWGIVTPRISEREPLVVHQGLIVSEGRVLLSVRRELRGWELPGGYPEPGEDGAVAVVREVREETGLRVRVERVVGDYVRTGFRPHTARVYACSVVGGSLTPSDETPLVRWFPCDRLPETIFPWFRVPIEDGLRGDEGRVRNEYQGFAAILAGMWIDVRMRISDHRAGGADPIDKNPV